MKPDEWIILQELRKDARRSLTEISYATDIPLSSVFKKVNKLEKNLIRKYVTLVDFIPLGFSIRVNLVLKSKQRENLRKFLSEHPNVNSLYRISQGFDFLVETIFPSMLGLENFLEEIDNLVSDKKIFHVIEDIRMEDFIPLENEFV